MKNLKTLLIEELTTRYDSERQLFEELPKLVKASTCNHLQEIITVHHIQTAGHLRMIDKIFRAFGAKSSDIKCIGTMGLLSEAHRIVESFKGTTAINAAIISAVQKIIHYEIASYGCLYEWAKVLKNDDSVGLLHSLLNDEKTTNDSLIELARSRSNLEALDQDSFEKYYDNIVVNSL